MNNKKIVLVTATRRNLLSQEEIYCHRKKFYGKELKSVTVRKFLLQEGTYFQRKISFAVKESNLLLQNKFTVA